MRSNAISRQTFHSVVSYGPGEGSGELEVLRAAIPTEERTVAVEPRWFPVDISEDLLGHAVRRVSREFLVPAQFRADFESDAHWIEEHLKPLLEGPSLFTMLGGTFANLRNGEREFLSGMRRLMSRSDALLLDVPTAEHGWSVAIEPRLHADHYSAAFRQFLCCTHHSASASAPAVDAFETRFRFEHRTQSSPHAELIRVLDSQTGEVILAFRRYRLGDLLDYFQEQGFRLLHCQSSLRVVNQAFSMAVVLLSIE
jgi:hypothetical protein